MASRLNISYLGPQATFTHQAAWRAFGEGAEYIPAETIDDVFTAVQRGEAHRGVVPVENSNEGVVTSTMDLLVDSTLVITGEVILPIRLMLLSRETDVVKISRVFSHPQAFAQCRHWLQKNLRGASYHDTRSTAEAAALCLSQEGAAAVAGTMASQLYGIPSLVDNIGDWDENLTRFLVFSTNPAAPSGDDKTSLVFSIKDKVGALFEILKQFGEAGINLTKIESRPSKKKAWDYVFFIDLEGHRDAPAVRDAISRLKEMCMFIKILGSYPKGKVEDN